MDGEFRIDLEDLIRNVEKAEVISIYFPLLKTTLLIDTRFDTGDSPLVSLVPSANSVDERVRYLKRLRPNYPHPTDITILPWTRRAQVLVKLGIWQILLDRLVYSGFDGAVQAFSDAKDEIERLESKELVSAIRGDNYYTIWKRKEYG